MTRRLLPVLVAGCAVLSGCGGAGHPHPANPSSAAMADSGRPLFSQACGACHTLTGHDDPRHQGGDLRAFHASRAQFLQFASEMPVRHALSHAQLQAIVRFVMSVEAGSAHGS